MTPEQAKIIMCMYEIDTLLSNYDEVAMLASNNPALLDAYRALYDLATGHKAKRKLSTEVRIV